LTEDPTADPDGGRPPEPRQGFLRHPRLPAAARNTASRQGRLGTLYLLTLLSTVDGSLLILAASGHLSSLGGAVAVGLTVIAGAGSWLAAHQAFAGRSPTGTDIAALGFLGLATVAATVASVWLGTELGHAVTLHVLPKVAGVVMFLVAAEIAGLRVPRVRGLPLTAVAVAAGSALEVGAQWIPS
jgi:hypothetical protein